MDILGIQSISHDTSCSLIKNNKLITCLNEERFNYEKHSRGFYFNGHYPKNSINYCFEKFIDKKIDAVAEGWDKKNDGNLKIKLDKFAITNKSYDLYPFNNFFKPNNIFNWKNALLGNLSFKPKINSFLKYIEKRSKKIFYVKHHLSHASSTFRTSGFRKSNILVMDGRGENESSSLFVGSQNKIELIRKFPVNKSLGFLYSYISQIIGFGPMDSGKTMALASYGKINRKYSIIKILKDDFIIDYKKLSLIEKNFGRKKYLIKYHKDLAATLQFDLEKLSLKFVEMLYENTGYKKLCLAGGVAHNCKMNGKLLNSSLVKDIFVFPACDDSGTSLGAALEIGYLHGINCNIELSHTYYGPEYSNEEIESVLKKLNIAYEFYNDIEGIVSELISKGKIIGWFQGRMEFGPRALGNRSILADPRKKEINIKLNDIKHREEWRPLAPSILEEHMKKYFINSYSSPFMNLSFDVRKEKVKYIPSAIHVDGSARVQTVGKKTNKRYYKLIKEFKKLTGVPILLNTSFNDKGQPIVRTPEDAIKTFQRMKLDNLAIGNYLISKQ